MRKPVLALAAILALGSLSISPDAFAAKAGGNGGGGHFGGGHFSAHVTPHVSKSSGPRVGQGPHVGKGPRVGNGPHVGNGHPTHFVRGHGRHFWQGRWWAYGVGPCWEWSDDYAEYVWVCF